MRKIISPVPHSPQYAPPHTTQSAAQTGPVPVDAQYGLASLGELSALFAADHLENIYALRTRTLNEPATAQAFARILLHLIQHRRTANSKEGGILLQAVTQNRQRMEEHGYRTTSEMLYKGPLFADHKRNKRKNYLSTIGRDEIDAETQTLFAVQRNFSQTWATPELEAKYLSILLRQRSFDKASGRNSPYQGDWAAKVGRCPLLPDKKRAFENAHYLQAIQAAAKGQPPPRD